MIVSLDTTPAAIRPDMNFPAREVAAPMRSAFAGVLPWAAFDLLCLLTRSAPESVARQIGAVGFDADFGLGDGG